MLAIFNPNAAGGRARRRGQRLEGAVACEVIWTDGPGHATEIAQRAYAEGERSFIVGGGDGTVFEVVNGLFPQTVEGVKGRCELGILPLGTGNSLVRDLGITTGEQALDAMRMGRRTWCDVVKLTTDEGELHYINLLSIGFTAAVGERTNRRFKGLGMAGYAVSTVVSLLRLQPNDYRVTVDGVTDDRPATFLSFCNSKHTGGTMQMAPDAKLSDGELDIIRVGPMGRRRLLTAFPRIYSGTHVQLPEIEASRAARVELDVGPVDMMIDGEIVKGTPRSLEVLPKALELMG